MIACMYKFTVFIFSAAETVPCCPKVAVNPGSSDIRPIPGYRVFLLIVTENGNCSEATAKDSTFELVPNQLSYVAIAI